MKKDDANIDKPNPVCLADLMREWVRAEISYAIANNSEGPDGYYGGGYSEEKEADRLFEALKRHLSA